MPDWAFIAIFLVIHVLDWFTTRAALSAGGRELNPIMRFVIDRTGFTGLLIAKLCMGFAIAYTLVVIGFAYLIWPVSAVYLVIIANNWRISRR